MVGRNALLSTDASSFEASTFQADLQSVQHRLAQLREEIGEESLGAVVNAIFSGIPDKLSQLSSAIDASDSFAVKQAAHSLAGYFGNYGAAQMANFCRQIEARPEGYFNRNEIVTLIHGYFEVLTKVPG